MMPIPAEPGPIIRIMFAMGISRITFMMNGASLPHPKLMSAIDLIASRVAPALREGVASAA